MTQHSRDESVVQPAPSSRPISYPEIKSLLREAMHANRERQEAEAIINHGGNSVLVDEALYGLAENRRDYLNSLLDQLWDRVSATLAPAR